MRECDGGTAWDRVESENYSIMSPNQNIQVSCIFVHQLQNGTGQLANAVGMCSSAGYYLVHNQFNEA